MFSMNIILCGYHWTGCKALQVLSNLGHNIFVYTHESPYHIPSLAEYSKELGIAYSTENISTSILPFKPDVICSIYYRYMIKKQIIDSCEGKIFNLHPSLLPEYKGCSSVTWALINGEDNAGFTYHYIDEDCDTGNILIQGKLSIEKWDTQETLFTRVMYESMKQFLDAFEMVINGDKGIKQTDDGIHYPRGCPYKGKINQDWDFKFKKRFIRAMTFPPYPVAQFGGKDIFFIKDLEK
jgi:methionyl-tRNA formyltransferase